MSNGLWNTSTTFYYFYLCAVLFLISLFTKCVHERKAEKNIQHRKTQVKKKVVDGARLFWREGGDVCSFVRSFNIRS